MLLCEGWLTSISGTKEQFYQSIKKIIDSSECAGSVRLTLQFKCLFLHCDSILFSITD